MPTPPADAGRREPPPEGRLTGPRLLGPADYRRVRWKNGGGWTTDVALCGHEPYRWRCSRADVEADGPFSDFSGYDRVIVLLSGNGCDLRFPGETVRLRQPLQQHRFRGEDAVYCTLVDGPCVDFNWVVSRQHYVGSVAALRAGEGTHAVVAYAVGDAEVRAGGRRVAVPAGHALVGERDHVQVLAGGPLLACDAVGRVAVG